MAAIIRTPQRGTGFESEKEGKKKRGKESLLKTHDIGKKRFSVYTEGEKRP